MTDSRDGEPSNAPGDLDALTETLKAVTTVSESAPGNEAETETQTEEKADKPEWLPEKFWTGDLETSLAKMGTGYRNLETAYGRMANDLGTQRKITDRILALDKRASDLGESQPAKKPTVDPSKLVNNPTEALEEYLAERDRTTQAQRDAERDREAAAQAEAAFLQKHPDFQEVAGDPDFVKWVQKSKVRTLAAQAAGTGNYVIADQLLDEWKETKSTVTTSNTSNKENLEAARRASTESAASSGGSTSSGKTYRRADLIELKMRRPDVYGDPRFQEEIQKAYAEGRVK